MFTATLDHTFHAAPSLPHLGGKCSSLHGHTWRVSVTFAGPYPGADGILVDFTPLSSACAAGSTPASTTRSCSAPATTSCRSSNPTRTAAHPPSPPRSPNAPSACSCSARTSPTPHGPPSKRSRSCSPTRRTAGSPSAPSAPTSTSSRSPSARPTPTRPPGTTPTPPTAATTATAVRIEAGRAIDNMPPDILRELLTSTAGQTAAALAADMRIPMSVARYLVDQVHADTVAEQQAQLDSEISQILNTPDK